jgi:hypothetical protein
LDNANLAHSRWNLGWMGHSRWNDGWYIALTVKKWKTSGDKCDDLGLWRHFHQMEQILRTCHSFNRISWKNETAIAFNQPNLETLVQIDCSRSNHSPERKSRFKYHPAQWTVKSPVLSQFIHRPWNWNWFQWWSVQCRCLNSSQFRSRFECQRWQRLAPRERTLPETFKWGRKANCFQFITRRKCTCLNSTQFRSRFESQWG